MSIRIKRFPSLFIALFFTVLFFVVLPLQGCLLVPFFESASELGATRGDREALLNDVLKKFQANMYWGNLNGLLKVSADQAKPKVRQFFKTATKDRKVVEAKLITTDPDDSYKKVQALVSWKTYPLDTLIIKEEKISEEWEFSYSDGWKLVNFEMDYSES